MPHLKIQSWLICQRGVPPLSKPRGDTPTPPMSIGGVPTPLRLHARSHCFAWSPVGAAGFRYPEIRGVGAPHVPGGVPTPPALHNKRGGPPPPLSGTGGGTTPPPAACTRVLLRVDSRRRCALLIGYLAGGVGTPHVPGWVPTPPALQNKRGGPLPPTLWQDRDPPPFS
jgi:hypothetical protein